MPERANSHGQAASLLKRIAERDDRALRELYDLHGSLLFAIALRMLRSREDAEQLVIDVFVEVWLHADRYDSCRGDGLNYLLLLTRSRSLDRLRARPQSTEPLPAEWAQPQDESPSPLENTLSMEQHRLIQDALCRLSAEERTVVELSFLDGYSHAEIAEKLNKPLGTVKTHARQGLIHLRGILRTVFRGNQEPQ